MIPKEFTSVDLNPKLTLPEVVFLKLTKEVDKRLSIIQLCHILSIETVSFWSEDQRKRPWYPQYCLLFFQYDFCGCNFQIWNVFFLLFNYGLLLKKAFVITHLTVRHVYKSLCFFDQYTKKCFKCDLTYLDFLKLLACSGQIL